jgi:hypothetical protein
LALYGKGITEKVIYIRGGKIMEILESELTHPLTHTKVLQTRGKLPIKTRAYPFKKYQLVVFGFYHP